MNQRGKVKTKTTPKQKTRPIPRAMSEGMASEASSKMFRSEYEKTFSGIDLSEIEEEARELDIKEFTEAQGRKQEEQEKFQNEIQRFIEISKYFSSPVRQTASYISEIPLVSYPNPFRVEYRRGGVTTKHIQFSNLTLEPVFLRLYKLIPELEQIKYVNLSMSRCKRIPPGLSFSLGFVYDDMNEKPPTTGAKMVFVASRKTTTPCYQVCEIDLVIQALKIKLVTV